MEHRSYRFVSLIDWDVECYTERGWEKIWLLRRNVSACWNGVDFQVQGWRRDALEVYNWIIIFYILEAFEEVFEPSSFIIVHFLVVG